VVRSPHPEEPRLTQVVPQGNVIIAATIRFKRAWDQAMAHNGEGLLVADLDIVEVHEAALDLIRVTGTASLQEALDVVHQFDR
jgi:hypothetical protein